MDTKDNSKDVEKIKEFRELLDERAEARKKVRRKISKLFARCPARKDSFGAGVFSSRPRIIPPFF